jgi:hypothetical protein
VLCKVKKSDSARTQQPVIPGSRRRAKRAFLPQSFGSVDAFGMELELHVLVQHIENVARRIGELKMPTNVTVAKKFVQFSQHDE